MHAAPQSSGSFCQNAALPFGPAFGRPDDRLREAMSPTWLQLVPYYAPTR